MGERKMWATHETRDWEWVGPVFSTGFFPVRSSRRTTPKAYTSLLSVSLPGHSFRIRKFVLKTNNKLELLWYQHRNVSILVSKNVDNERHHNLAYRLKGIPGRHNPTFPRALCFCFELPSWQQGQSQRAESRTLIEWETSWKF